MSISILTFWDETVIYVGMQSLHVLNLLNIFSVSHWCLIHNCSIIKLTFQKMDLFPSLGEEWETPTLSGPLGRANLNHWRLMLALSKGPNRIGVTLPSSKGGRRSIFRNVMFYSYLEFRTVDSARKSSTLLQYSGQMSQVENISG
jgi:hypothetical protein